MDHLSPQHRDDALREQIARCRDLLKTHTSVLVSDSERMLDAVARLAHVGYWEDEIQAKRLSWSAQACAVIGLPPTDRERSWDEFRQLVHPDDRPAVDEARVQVH